MPANDSFRLDDDQGRSPIALNFAWPNPEEPLGRRRLGTLDRATQDTELVPEGEALQLEDGSRFAGSRRTGGGHVNGAERHTEELVKDSWVFSL